MRRVLVTFGLMLALVFGFALAALAPTTAEAHSTSGAHWHYWPGSATTSWYNNCGKYSPYDSGAVGEPADCRWSPPYCEWHAQFHYGLVAQYVQAYQLDGDFFNYGGPIYSGATCNPYT